MGYYFDDFLSINVRNGGDVRSALRTVADRYIGENPPSAPIFRTDSSEGILRSADYRYRFNLSERFPDAPDFSVAYAWGALYMESGRSVPLTVSIGGPLKVYLNGELVFKSHIGHERTADQRHRLDVRLEEGWNNFVLEFMRTPRGFGGVFGTANKKSFAFHFLGPSAESAGSAGWLFSAPMKERLPRLPAFGERESDTGIEWLPRRQWNAEELSQGVFRRLFGMRRELYARSWTRGDFRQRLASEYRLRGIHEGDFKLWINGVELYAASDRGSFDIPAKISYGIHDVVVESRCGERDWGFELSVDGPDVPVRFFLPVVLQNRENPWLHSGPFSESLAQGPAEILSLNKLSHTADGLSYFRLDRPGTFIRPYMESGNFGHWHYPIGVNLYGLLVAGRILESADIEMYARQHLQMVADWYEYARWDGATYGASSILHHLFQMDCLDDCGSGGAALLEAALRVGIENFHPLVDDIAHYIEDIQERLDDGAFYRDKADNPFMAGTIWSDDLYMSVPFLCRYWRLSSEDRYIEDAVRQFRLYREYLFIPGKDVMSHVYDVSAHLANAVPWGRGNGWVLFSLTELLSAIGEAHPAYDELESFYQILCDGYLRLQDEDGMWHQVLTDHESYPEASCTSMFLYSFSRGLRLGWLRDTAFDIATQKAWRALCSNAVDHKGNVYGICRGSGFSFTESYYKDELSWNLNDLHGIGILLLAGAEFLNLEQSRSPWAI